MEIYAKGMGYLQLNEAVRACTDNRISIRGCNGQRFIACASSGRQIDVHGVAGNGAGAYMESGVVNVYGNAQDALADTMNGGEVYVFGSCGDAAAYAMRGGEVFVRGDAGYRAGVHMKEYGEHVPALIIGGRAGCFLGEYLAGGIIAVLNLQNSAQALGEEAARGMHGGRIYVRGGIGVPLPDCVTARTADKEDMRVLVGYLKKFCAAFGGDAKKLAAEEFTLITPANKASKRLYAGN